MTKKDKKLKKIVRDMLDEAITYGEYVVPKKTLEELAKATDYKLPKD